MLFECKIYFLFELLDIKLTLSSLSISVSLDQVVIDHAIHTYQVDPTIASYQSGNVWTPKTNGNPPKLKFKTNKQLLLVLINVVSKYVNVDSAGTYSIQTTHTTNSANAGMYGKISMEKYVQEYTPPYSVHSRYRLAFDADLKTERPKVVAFLKDVCKYGNPETSAKTAKLYRDCE